MDRLLDALIAQTLSPLEIVLVDDGSNDDTLSRVRRRAAADPRIRCLARPRRGPAAARNDAWKAAQSLICAFTDGDCVPEPTWLERLCRPFASAEVGASAGTYRTLNGDHLLARFIGLEIAWRYRRVGDTVDCHGTYNLAVRRALIEEIGGFDESYRFPSGEDFDLTYRIAARQRIAFVADAVVGHDHPERLRRYLGAQVRRARDRVRLYRDHPHRLRSDSYTGASEKYQVLAAGLLVASLGLGPAFPLAAAGLAGAMFVWLVVAAIPPTVWLFEHSPAAAWYGALVRLLRCFAWALGVALGAADLLLRRARTPATSSRP